MQVGLLTINSPDGESTVAGFEAGAGADPDAAPPRETVDVTLVVRESV
jgi:hypothetical protein